MNQSNKSPYLHDKWDDQVALEHEMLAMGRTRMQDRINKARKKKDMTRLRPYRSLITEMIDPVTEHLKHWLEKAVKKPGPKPIALPLLKEIDPATCALVALRTVFRMLGIERRLIMGLAIEIGTWIEHEARAAKWMDEDPDTWNSLKAYYDRRGSNSAHLKRARVSIFNKHIKDKIGFTEWTDEQRRRVGLQMIDCVVQGTGRFKVVADKTAATAKTRKGVKIRWPMVLHADDGLMDWLSAAMDDELVFSPVFMPTLIPPKPWNGPKDGGYWTPFVKTPFLVRFKASHESQRQRAIDEYMALDMSEVYEALNFVQETGWKINQRVFDVAKKVWDKDLAIAGFPRQEEEHVPARPVEAEHDEDIRKEWNKHASKIRTRNAKRISHYIGLRRCLIMAERLHDESVFYFPHMLDFRGRMYPIVSDLSPQGEDLHRGLLTFHEGKPIGEDGAQWLAVQIANLFGVDKVSLEDRVKWTTAKKDDWLLIASDPIANREWCDADDPWQALAAIFELVEFYKQGPTYISHLPIRVDGSCNGIQHLSAMVKDEVGGAAVNLLESDAPRDIYQEVADILYDRLDKRRGDIHADMWLELFDVGIPRSVTKRPVMILPYGGSRMAYIQYTREWLEEHDPDAEYIPEEHRNKALGYLIKLMWDAVSEKVVKAREVMEWLQQCSKVAATSGLPLYWVTPMGFVVRHFYGERKMRKIETNIDGQRVQLGDWQIQPTLDKRSQAKGIAPNFVHSMDASALMACAIICKDNGITALTTIHDSYGTHASDMWTLYTCIREGFIQTYQQPVLQDFQAACGDVLGCEKATWPRFPSCGNLDLEAVRHSDYFFA